jgi:type VI secretion system secreted protein Hcp
MAITAYLTIKNIPGPVTEKGHENAIQVLAVEHSIQSQHTGGGAGNKPQHAPIKITKLIDQATPRLYAVLITGGHLPSCELEFWQSSSRQPYYTVKLTDVSIVGITSSLPNREGQSRAEFLPYEEVTIAYHGIEWTWVEGNITAEDKGVP